MYNKLKRYVEKFWEYIYFIKCKLEQIIQKSLIGKNRFAYILNAEDLLFNYQTIDYDTQIKVIPKNLYVYNVRENSLSKDNGFESLYNDAIMRLKIIEKMCKNKSSEKAIMQAVSPLISRYFYLKMFKNKRKEVLAYKKRIKNIKNLYNFDTKNKLILKYSTSFLYYEYSNIKKKFS